MKREFETEGVGTLLTHEEAVRVKVGDRLRIVDTIGRVAQGSVEKVFGYRSDESHAIQVAGIAWQMRAITVYSLDQDNVQEIVPDRVELTAGALRDIIAGQSERDGVLGKPCAVGMDRIVRAALGFDPVGALPDRAYGGKAKSAWTNEHLALTSLKKLLATMVDAGELRAVVSGNRFERTDNDDIVSFSGGRGGVRAGWVLESAYQESRATVSSAKAADRVAALREQARGLVADRHMDEVEAELAKLLAAE